MKEITTLILGLFLIGIAGAVCSGDTLSYEFEDKVINCSIENNTYNLEGLNLSWNNSTVNIITQINYKPDNFDLVCWINESSVVKSVKRSSRSGKLYIPLLNITNVTNITDITNVTNITDIDNEIVITDGELIEEHLSFIMKIKLFFKRLWDLIW